MLEAAVDIIFFWESLHNRKMSISETNELLPYVVVDDFFVNWGAKVSHIQLPYHVQQTIYELALNYSLQQPTDPLGFCIEFLTDLRSSKKVEIAYDLADADVDRPHEIMMKRRRAKFGKTFDPSQVEEQEVASYPKSEWECAQLKRTLRDLLFFKSLDENEMTKVVNAMFQKSVYKGDKVIQEGDDGDFFYVVQSGTFNAYKKEGNAEKELCQYDSTGYFGELALLYNQPRAASVEAITDGVLWCLDRETFQKIVITSSYQRSKWYESMIAKVPVLVGLSEAEKIKLADSLKRMDFSDNEIIIRQGDPADGMYFVEEGVVRVVLEDRAKSLLVARLTEGDYFGELALITKKPRALSVVAEGDVRVAFLDVGAFERLLGPCMSIMKRNIELYQQQLHDIIQSNTATELRQSVKT